MLIVFTATQTPGVWIVDYKRMPRFKQQEQLKHRYPRYYKLREQQELAGKIYNVYTPQVLTREHPEINSVFLYWKEVHANTLLQTWYKLNSIHGWLTAKEIDTIDEALHHTWVQHAVEKHKPKKRHRRNLSRTHKKIKEHPLGTFCNGTIILRDYGPEYDNRYESFNKIKGRRKKHGQT